MLPKWNSKESAVKTPVQCTCSRILDPLIKTYSKSKKKTNSKEYPSSNTDLYTTWLDFDNEITCNDGNTSPTTKFDSQLATPAVLTAAALELWEKSSAVINQGIAPKIKDITRYVCTASMSDTV